MTIQEYCIVKQWGQIMASQEENDLHIVRFHEISICELEVMLYISVGLGHGNHTEPLPYRPGFSVLRSRLHQANESCCCSSSCFPIWTLAGANPILFRQKKLTNVGKTMINHPPNHTNHHSQMVVYCFTMVLPTLFEDRG